MSHCGPARALTHPRVAQVNKRKPPVGAGGRSQPEGCKLVSTSEDSPRLAPAAITDGVSGAGSYPPLPGLPHFDELLSVAIDHRYDATCARRVWPLAGLLAARRSMRLWDPALGTAQSRGAYRERAQRLSSKRLPDLPAAVPLYSRGKTRLLALDFDARHTTVENVLADVRRCLGWIYQCGGRAIVDYSTSGGCHILVPLPIGTALSRNQIEPIVRLLAARLGSLDLTPMLNPETGCVTPPGSRCREGGFRALLGTLDDAVDALTVRSAPGILARMVELLGGAGPRTITTPSTVGQCPTCAPPCTAGTECTSPRRHLPFWEGRGEHARLSAHIRLRSPIPYSVRNYAVHGVGAPDGRWSAPNGRLDHSAARQSVLAAAALRGFCLADIHAQLPPAGGDWAGFWRAYERYGRGARSALSRDWAKACDWAVRTAPEFLPSVHKKPGHTGGWRGEPSRARKQVEWLAAATVWVDAQWPRSPRRHTILAVLPGLAHASVIAGAVVRGTPLVEVGGRSLSLMACLAETTVWEVLRDLREVPGAPILRSRQAAGVLADAYALVAPRVRGRRVRPDTTDIQRVRVEPVHEAWSVLGLHCRRIYELVLHHHVATPADAFAAAKMSRTAGYSALATLTTAGLLIHQHNRITGGPVHLDSIASAHGIPQARRDRINRHQRQRVAWHEWLHNRFGLDTEPAVDSQSCAHIVHTRTTSAQPAHPNAPAVRTERSTHANKSSNSHSHTGTRASPAASGGTPATNPT